MWHCSDGGAKLRSLHISSMRHGPWLPQDGHDSLHTWFSELRSKEMGFLSGLDRLLRPWHVIALNSAALAWFVTLTLTSRAALPGVALFRCPIGFCAGGYSPEDIFSMLDEIGEEGRHYLHNTLLWADLLLPALLVAALLADIIWFSRPGARVAVALQPAARLTLLAVPLVYGIADYLENWAIANMLHLYPNIDDLMAERTSLLTAAKSQLVAASVGIAAALAVAALGSAGSRRGSRAPTDD